MLTITTSKEKLERIARGEENRIALPLTDYWTTRILNALGFSKSEEKQIVDNLRKGRPGTTDAVRQIQITAGGSVSAKADVTFSIGKLNEKAAETYLVKINSISLLNQEENKQADPEGQIVYAAGVDPDKDKAPKMIRVTAECKYCHNFVAFFAPEGLTQKEYDRYAVNYCDCKDAQNERIKMQKLKAAKEWAANTFTHGGALQTVLAAIAAVMNNEADSVSLKVGKYTYRIRCNADGIIKVNAQYRDNDEQEF